MAGERSSEAGERSSGAGERSSGAGERRLEAGERRLEAGERSSEAGERSSGAGERSSEAGESRLEAGERRLEAGERRLEAGERSSEAGERRLEAGERSSEAGERRLEAGERRLEAGERRLEAGERSSGWWSWSWLSWPGWWSWSWPGVVVRVSGSGAAVAAVGGLCGLVYPILKELRAERVMREDGTEERMLGFWSLLVLSLLAGFVCCFLSWTLDYLNAYTPQKPQRRDVFLSRGVAVLNGLMAVLTVIWSLS